MRKLTAVLAAGMVAAVAVPAVAQDTKAEVVERSSSGKATKVKIGDKVYAVCTADQQDSCINPREAGLNFGNVPLDHWPGHPASED